MAMSLPKHSGSEKRNVAANTTSGTPNGFSVTMAATHKAGDKVDWIHFRCVIGSVIRDSDILAGVAEAAAM